MEILNKFLEESKNRAIRDYTHYKTLITWLEKEGCCEQKLIIDQVLNHEDFKKYRVVMIPYKSLGFNVNSLHHATIETQYLVEFEREKTVEIFESLGLMVEVATRDKEIFFTFKGVSPRMASILTGKELVENKIY